jgi:UDP-glucose 4-epimerase
MTRFLLTLEDAVDTIYAAVRAAEPGETYIPRCPSAKMTDLAAYLIGDRDIETVITGIRPGEKIHEILLSEEEATRTVFGYEGYYALRPMLPELAGPVEEPALVGDYSSANALMTHAELAAFLETRIPEVIGKGFLEA